jgi:hypothetical protein
MATWVGACIHTLQPQGGKTYATHHTELPMRTLHQLQWENSSKCGKILECFYNGLFLRLSFDKDITFLGKIMKKTNKQTRKQTTKGTGW